MCISVCAVPSTPLPQSLFANLLDHRAQHPAADGCLFYALCHRYTGTGDVGIGIVLAGGKESDLEEPVEDVTLVYKWNNGMKFMFLNIKSKTK